MWLSTFDNSWVNSDSFVVIYISKNNLDIWNVYGRSQNQVEHKIAKCGSEDEAIKFVHSIIYNQKEK